MTMYKSEKVLPYVYKGVHKTTGMIYIGSRTTPKLCLPSSEDLYTYRTSSKYVHPIFDEFDWTIVAEFFDSDAAYDHEQLMIYEQWQESKAMSLNKSCFHNKKRWNPSGIKRTDEQRANLSKLHTGEKHPPERNARKSKRQTILYDFLTPEGIVIYDMPMKEFCAAFNFKLSASAIKKKLKANKSHFGFQLIGASESNPNWLLKAREKYSQTTRKINAENPEAVAERNRNVSKGLTKNFYDFLTPDGFVIENLSMKQLCSLFNLDYFYLAKNSKVDKEYKGFYRLWLHGSA